MVDGSHVCHGWHDAVPGAKCDQAFPGRFHAGGGKRKMNNMQEADYGTPASPDPETVSIEIDGIAATARRGDSILRAAREFGVDIPKLCATDSLKAFGSCRLCVVEVEGRKGLSRILHDDRRRRHANPHPDSGNCPKLRRNVMELYISDHPLDCLTCSANGDCELQDMAGAVGLRDVRYGFDGDNHLDAEHR